MDVFFITCWWNKNLFTRVQSSNWTVYNVHTTVTLHSSLKTAGVTVHLNGLKNRQRRILLKRYTLSHKMVKKLWDFQKFSYSLPGSGSLSFSSWVRLTVRSRGASDVSDKGDEVLVVTPFVLVWSRHFDAYSIANWCIIFFISSWAIKGMLESQPRGTSDDGKTDADSQFSF